MFMDIHVTNQNEPAMWEKGGGRTTTGYVVVVAGKKGARLTPIHVRTGGNLANMNHALLPIDVGSYVITLDRHNDDFGIRVYQITGVDVGAARATFYAVADYNESTWSAHVPECLADAIQAAKEKSRCYHCREPHFIKMAEQEQGARDEE